ncbi:MAG: response regulator [Spirochaetales bacterium]|nr:response regulator [Spirochaetales bacterium]
MPVAVKGEIDLTGYDLASMPSVPLKGEWEFYWDRLLFPDDFKKSQKPEMTGYINVPGSVYQYMLEDGRSIGNIESVSNATFRLLVKSDNFDGNNMLLVEHIPNPYRVYVNGKKLLTSGRIGQTKEEMITQLLTRAGYFPFRDRELEIIFQIGGNDHKNGIRGLLFLGNAQEIQSSRLLKGIIYGIMCGIIFFMAFYHLVIFLMRTKELNKLYFGIFCFFIILYLLLNDNPFEISVLSSLFWAFQLKLSYFAFFMSVAFFVLYLWRLFPKDFFKLPAYILSGIAVLFTVTLLFVPILYVGQFVLLPYQVITLLVVPYCIIFSVKALIRKRHGSLIFIISIVLLCSAVLMDTLLALQYVVTRIYFFPFGVVCFCISQSVLLSRNFIQAYQDREVLMLKIQDSNIRLKELDKLKDEFLANTTHELQTPLHGIIGIAESLRDMGLDMDKPEQKRNFDLIIHSGKRLSILINDIMEFSQLKNSEIQLDRKSVNLRQIVEVVAVFSRQLVKGKPVSIENGVGEEILVYADENRLQQILYNLIGNAVKFTETGTISVLADKKGKLAEVRVRDTGIGIKQEDHEKIFESFKQADGTPSKQHYGVGLGLAITRKLVSLHGGSIHVESREGAGSTFIFTLPLSMEKRAAVSGDRELLAHINDRYLDGDDGNDKRVESKTDREADENRIKVLIVDDEEVNRQVLSNYLNAEDRYAVQTAESGMQAMQFFENEEDLPDIVLLDIMMPGLSGYDVCQMIREKHPQIDLPIIIVTARNNIDDLVMGFNMGANDYIPKPFARTELLARIRMQADLIEFRNKESEINIALFHADRLITLGTSISEIAHEIKNFSAVIKLNIDVLYNWTKSIMPMLDEIQDEKGDFMVDNQYFSEIRTEYLELFQRITKNIKNILNLIQSVKKFAQKETLVSEDVNLTRIMEDTEKICAVRAKKKKVEIVKLLQVVPVIEGNNQYLLQAFVNLVNNAIEAIEGPDGRVILMTALDEKENLIKVSVQDNGVGIAGENCGKIFQKFYTSKRASGGLGLGLPLVQKIVKAHHGEIMVQSEVNEGTTITVTLPLNRQLHQNDGNE